MSDPANLQTETEISLEQDLKDILQPRQLLPIYKLWARRVKDITDKSFLDQAAPYEKGKWKELSPRYKRYKENYNGKRKPKPVGGGRYKLRWTDEMRKSLFYNASDDGVEFGTAYTVKGGWNLGAIHSFGAARANIPARPFLPINSEGTPLPELEEELIQIAEDYLTDNLG